MTKYEFFIRKSYFLLNIMRDLKDSTKRFALNIFYLCDQLPDTPAFRIYKGQLIRCASSVGANYRASCRAKSNKDFINKLKIVEEEVDESAFFLEILKDIDSKKYNSKYSDLINPLWDEANQLTAIFVTSIKTARKNKNKT